MVQTLSMSIAQHARRVCQAQETAHSGESRAYATQGKVADPAFLPIAASTSRPGRVNLRATCQGGTGLEVADGVGSMSDARQALGKRGEDLACEALQRRGYAILARRYRRRGGELDIVARDGPTLVFVEVKARDGSAFGSGGEAITALKRRRLAMVADDYLLRHRLVGCACRFDVVAIDVRAGRPVIEIYTNAFDVTSWL